MRSLCVIVAASLVSNVAGLCTGKSNTPICAAASQCDDMCDGGLKCSDMAAAFGCAAVTGFSNCPQKCPCTCPPGAPVPSPTSAKTGSCTGKGSCSTQLAQWQIESVLERHNAFRAYHGACPLTYKQSIADYSITSTGFQQTCSTGTLNHNKPPQYAGGTLGENLAMAGGPKDVHNYDPADGVMNWYCSEEPCWSYASSSESDVTGHFTQVVWKESSTVGCALCQRGGGTSYDVFLICNYEAAGNSARVQGIGSPYETNVGGVGTAASGCSASPTTSAPAPTTPAPAGSTSAPGVPPTPAPAGSTSAPGVPPTPAPAGSTSAPGVPTTPAPAGSTSAPGAQSTPSPQSSVSSSTNKTSVCFLIFYSHLSTI